MFWIEIYFCIRLSSGDPIQEKMELVFKFAEMKIIN
jgi:hypothetical protein